MAIFTLNGAASSANALKYEQLDGTETITSNGVLPTAAATQVGAGIDKRGLEGTILQSASLAPLHAMLGNTGPESTSGSASGAQTLPDTFGAQAANQSFAGVATALSNPGNVNQSGDTTNTNNNIGGDIATSSSLLSNNSAQTTIFNNVTNNPPVDNPPANPPGGDPILNLPTGPVVVGDINTGLLPDLHIDLPSLQNLPTITPEQVVTPITNLVTGTLTDVIANPTDITGNVQNLVTGTLDAVHGVLDARRDELAAANAWAQAYANKALVGYDLERGQ